MAEYVTIGEALPTQVDGLDVLGAVCNNMVVSLAMPYFADPEVRPLTRADDYGFEIYRSSLVFLLAKCAEELAHGSEFRVRQSISQALYCTWAPPARGPAKATGDIARLSAALADLVRADVPITAQPVPYKNAVEALGKLGRVDELNLLRHRNPPAVLLSCCGDFRALNQTPLAPRTGALDLWELLPADGGFILNVPPPETPHKLRRVPATAPFFKIFRHQAEHRRMTGVETLGDLNQAILEKRFDVFVRTVEAMQTKDLAQIADKIAARGEVRLVLLAGPSSAGKTTTAHRLCTQLRVVGLRPLLLSTDDYFVGDARNPRDAEGNLDYETVKAVDDVRLAADLGELFAGKAVHLRKFDFLKHDGYDAKETTRLPSDGVVVLEGIHALNPSLTAALPDNVKFRVYLNALTQLVVDSCNRISTTDTRLLRRLVRDFHFRGMSPIDTFRLWPNVVAGERKWIYPYQAKADAVFNSALDYELAVLKPFASELLNQVKPWDVAFAEARRLSGILHNVSPAPADCVPGDSILRETIGGSQLTY